METTLSGVSPRGGPWACSSPAIGSARWIGLDSGEETDNLAAMLKDAAWIWHPGGKSTDRRADRHALLSPVGELPAARRVRKAIMLATADDSFVVFVNGKPVGGGRSWAEVKLFDVTDQLREGLNTLAVAATNSPSANVPPEHNPAGLIGILKVEFDEGEPLLSTDRHALANQRQDLRRLGKARVR